MQTSSPQPQRQPLASTVGGGWMQAVRSIAINSLITGSFILVATILPVLRWSDRSWLVVMVAIAIIAFALSRPVAKIALDDCRHNHPCTFSDSVSISGGLFGLVLLALLSAKPERESLMALAIAGWWTVAGAMLLGVGLWQWLWLAQTKHSRRKDSNTIGHLDVEMYSDRTVVVSPNALAQQPRQFNSLSVLLVSLFFWTMVELPVSLKALLTIAIAASGLTGFSPWRLQLHLPLNRLYLSFSGLWDLQATYEIDLKPFSRLAVVKLKEGGGDLSWTQLSGNSTEITLPAALAGITSQIDSERDELEQIVREHCHLANHETSRDSLGLVGVLLPQGAGILAGLSLLIVGTLLLLFSPLPVRWTFEGTVLLFSTCAIAPSLARYLLKLVAPNGLTPKESLRSQHFQAWEIGVALLLALSLSPTSASNATILPLLALMIGWLSFMTGACILALVRRTPIINKA